MACRWKAVASACVAAVACLCSCGPRADDLKVGLASIEGVSVTGVAKVDGKFIVAFRCANGTRDDYTTPVRPFEESKAEISQALRKYCLGRDVEILRQQLEDIRTKP